MECFNIECDFYNEELSNRCDVNNWSESADCKTRRKFDLEKRKEELDKRITNIVDVRNYINAELQKINKELESK